MEQGKKWNLDWIKDTSEPVPEPNAPTSLLGKMFSKVVGGKKKEKKESK